MLLTIPQGPRIILNVVSADYPVPILSHRLGPLYMYGIESATLAPHVLRGTARNWNGKKHKQNKEVVKAGIGKVDKQANTARSRDQGQGRDGEEEKVFFPFFEIGCFCCMDDTAYFPPWKTDPSCSAPTLLTWVCILFCRERPKKSKAPIRQQISRLEALCGLCRRLFWSIKTLKLDKE